MKPPRPLVLDFDSLARSAALCSAQWRTYAKTNPLDPRHAIDAHTLAQLFDQQAEILARMHRTRVEWQPTPLPRLIGPRR